MRILGGRSGFKTARELILFFLGMGICVFHILTTDPSDLSWQLLLFGGGLAGSPGIMRLDEKRNKE